ncbi:hypothetical protein IV203_020584 [Nitzschia inconspicua]|uniref:Uncharacterized protein n=1 Tax=Nitzschia inconspicua TaxID=303405 RepID=A0A9K3PD84_9STRA|nr:hypothetical protein IV203_020584 [Nitzschia inconspicua]
MFGDDSQLRLRKSHGSTPFGGLSATKPMDCEEGGAAGVSLGSDHTSNNNNNNNLHHPHNHHHHHHHHSSNLMSSLHGSSSSGLNLPSLDPFVARPSMGPRIKGNRTRQRRRKVVMQYCRLCWSGLAATLVSVTLSLLLLPFSWVQVDYHHQVQHEFEYVYQVLADNRRNYNTILRGIHRHEKQMECPSGGIGFENDDYCDCLHDNGFDEPNTSACSGRTVGQNVFQCHRDKDVWIFASRVGDGILDCPDGSDEL